MHFIQFLAIIQASQILTYCLSPKYYKNEATIYSSIVCGRLLYIVAKSNPLADTGKIEKFLI